MTTEALLLEAQRQRLLVQALWRDAPDAALDGWLQPRLAAPGLAAYRANGAAAAERALAVAYPTLQQLVGDESFGALARAFWRRHPPERGDLAQWGAALPGFVAADPQLADEPVLADMARLEWAVHTAAQAADAPPPAGLERLGDTDPARLHLRLAPGTALVASPHPIATVWQAHRLPPEAADRFAPVRQAYAQGLGETALVRREGWVVQVHALAPPVACFTQALLDGAGLGAALDAAGPGFDFQPWLIDALRCGALAAVETSDP